LVISSKRAALQLLASQELEAPTHFLLVDACEVARFSLTLHFVQLILELRSAAWSSAISSSSGCRSGWWP
jgi:hypothetical protein